MKLTNPVRKPTSIKARAGSRAPRGFNPFADLMGLVVSRPRDGRCRASFTVAAEHLNPNRVAHGGTLYTMADTAMGAAIHSVLERGIGCVTIELKINYLKPVRDGRVSCTAKVVQCGKRVAVVEAEMKNRGVLVAKALGTFAVIPRPPVDSNADVGQTPTRQMKSA
jgi:acyl-CoA thioesterase